MTVAAAESEFDPALPHASPPVVEQLIPCVRSATTKSDRAAVAGLPGVVIVVVLPLPNNHECSVVKVVMNLNLRISRKKQTGLVYRHVAAKLCLNSVEKNRQTLNALDTRDGEYSLAQT